MKNIKYLIIVVFLLAFKQPIISQTKSYSYGSLSYELPLNWREMKLVKNTKGISYGGMYVNLGELIQFSVIEMKAPPNKTTNLIGNSDLKGAIKSIFHPEAVFNNNATEKYLGGVKTRYLEAKAYPKGKVVYSMNHVVIYKGNLFFIQGIFRTRNVNSARKTISRIFNSVKFQ